MKNGSDVIFSSDIAKKVLASFMNEVYYLSRTREQRRFFGTGFDLKEIRI